jgi:catechol 2,3-dioxygenase-like lactoylglutathione lyase family enzyme
MAAMTALLNHTIVWCRDQEVSARFLSDMLGLPAPSRFGGFLVVDAGNEVSLDYKETSDDIAGQHYAFLVSEGEFDLILARLRDGGREWWADPHQRQPHVINHEDGGRGLYWEGPDGHWLEIITRPYGSGG